MKRLLISGAAVAAAVVVLAGCGSGGGNKSSSAAGQAGTATVSAKNLGSAGRVLVDSSGQPLYANDQENGGMVLCTREHASPFGCRLPSTAPLRRARSAGSSGCLRGRTESSKSRSTESPFTPSPRTSLGRSAGTAPVTPSAGSSSPGTSSTRTAARAHPSIRGPAATAAPSATEPCQPPASGKQEELRSRRRVEDPGDRDRRPHAVAALLGALPPDHQGRGAPSRRAVSPIWSSLSGSRLASLRLWAARASAGWRDRGGPESAAKRLG